jgi:hypothetical protein
MHARPSSEQVWEPISSSSAHSCRKTSTAHQSQPDDPNPNTAESMVKTESTVHKIPRDKEECRGKVCIVELHKALKHCDDSPWPLVHSSACGRVHDGNGKGMLAAREGRVPCNGCQGMLAAREGRATFNGCSGWKIEGIHLMGAAVKLHSVYIGPPHTIRLCMQQIW